MRIYGAHHIILFCLGVGPGSNFDDPPDGSGSTGGDATNVHEP